MGSFDFKCMGKEKMVCGKDILKGIAKFKAKPEKYIALTYQKNMITWPKKDQEYSLIYRAGTERLEPANVCPTGWMTILMQKYQHLPSFENDELPEEFRDGYTREMLMSHRGVPINKKPILPGRGMGVADTPLVKIIGDIDPNGKYFFVAALMLSWLLVIQQDTY